MKTFSQRLKAAMARGNLSQSALAEKSGCSKAAVSQYLSGKNLPGEEKLQALAEAAGVSVEFLQGQEDRREEIAEAPAILRIGTRTAARCLGKSTQFVRVGLQRGLLPFGVAVPGSGRQWNYYINPVKFREYVGAELFDAFFGAGGEKEGRQWN